MNKLMISFLAAGTLFALGGCKKKGGGDALAKMEGFQKQMCDCKDKACADKVNDDMTKWGTEMAKTANKDEKPDREMAKKSADIMTKYTECMTKLMMAGAGGSGGGDMAGSAAGSGSAAGGSDTGGSAAAGSDDKGSAAAGSDDKGGGDDKKDDGSAAK